MTNNNHQEIRSEAASLAWVLSGAIKNTSPLDSILGAERFSLIGKAINYLLSVVCDDWSQVNGTTAELEALGLSNVISGFEGGNVQWNYITDRWFAFVKLVADEEGCPVPSNKECEVLSKTSKSLFTQAGFELGYLKSQSKFLGKNQWVVAD